MRDFLDCGVMFSYQSCSSSANFTPLGTTPVYFPLTRAKKQKQNNLLINRVEREVVGERKRRPLM